MFKSSVVGDLQRMRLVPMITQDRTIKILTRGKIIKTSWMSFLSTKKMNAINVIQIPTSEPLVMTAKIPAIARIEGSDDAEGKKKTAQEDIAIAMMNEIEDPIVNIATSRVTATQMKVDDGKEESTDIEKRRSGASGSLKRATMIAYIDAAGRGIITKATWKKVAAKNQGKIDLDAKQLLAYLNYPSLKYDLSGKNP